MNGKPKTIDFNYSIITFSAFQINIDLFLSHFFFLLVIKHHIHLCSAYRNYNISLYNFSFGKKKSKNRSALVAIEKNVKIQTRINTLIVNMGCELSCLFFLSLLFTKLVYFRHRIIIIWRFLYLSTSARTEQCGHSQHPRVYWFGCHNNATMTSNIMPAQTAQFAIARSQHVVA